MKTLTNQKDYLIWHRSTFAVDLGEKSDNLIGFLDGTYFFKSTRLMAIFKDRKK